MEKRKLREEEKKRNNAELYKGDARQVRHEGEIAMKIYFYDRNNKIG